MTKMRWGRAMLMVGVMAWAGCAKRGPTTAESPAADEESPFEKWSEVLEDTEPIEGFFTVHHKRDNTVYMEIPESMLDKDFGLTMHISQGTGVFNVHEGLPLSSAQLMRFQRVGDRIVLQHRNARFTADEGTPIRTSVEGNVAHSVVAAWDIESQHDSTENLLVDVTKFLVSDYAELGRRLQPYYNDRAASLESDRSYVSEIQGFPENVEIDAMLTYTSSERPTFGGEGIPDVRSVPIGVRYSIYKLPDEPMRMRLADDRVGHFLDAVKDYSRDQEETLYVQIVRRWRLEKKDPTAAMSEPVEPLVFYIDHTVPEEYRPWVRDGIEAWNGAFEQAGFRNAIVARDAPDDSTWSAEDIRYSAVRWTAGHQMGYAIGPSQSDPRTGEQLNGDVLISQSFMQGWLWNYERLANPGQAAEPRSDLEWMIAAREQIDAQALDLDAFQLAQLCFAEVGKAHQLGFQHAALLGLGTIDPGSDSDPDVPDEYLRTAVMDLILHEVGHVLGLRHNFKSSAGVPSDRLHDATFTGRNGVSLSVMDYNPVNISPDPDAQGDYWTSVAGPYDRWAIQYAYSVIYDQPATGPLVTSGTPAASAEDELHGLRKIAAQGADAMHPYGTDEDNWLGSFAVDPLTSAWELGSDHVAYARSRQEVVAKIMPTVADRIVDEGDGYQRLRNVVNSLMFERLNATVPLVKYVGGAYVARDHKGDPNQRPAFTPVAPEKQREAVQLIIESMLAEGSYTFDEELLNRLLPNRWNTWGESPATILRFPVLSNMQAIHGSLLRALMTPPRLARMLDQETLAEPGGDAYTVDELFRSLTGAVWTELGRGSNAGNATPVRRNLQRLYTDQLTSLALTTSAPGDAVALARLELADLSGRLGRALSGTRIDRVNRAHLADTRARIDRTLGATVVID